MFYLGNVFDEVEEFFDMLGLIEITDLMNQKEIPTLQEIFSFDNHFWMHVIIPSFFLTKPLARSSIWNQNNSL